MTESDSFTKLKGQLKTLFRSEDKDLNFGIYRIMNELNKEIDEFIDKELPDMTKKELSKLKSDVSKEIDEEIKETEKKAQELGVDPNTLDKYKELVQKKKQNKSIQDLEDSIYNHIVRFFERYFQDGDFIPRFYFKEGTYLIPYDGSEVDLHWATKDMYFIKSSDQYNRFSFDAKDKTVIFKVAVAQEEKGNQKGTNQYFQLENIEKNDGEIIVSFRRVYEDEEIQKLGKNKTERQDKLNEQISEEIKKEIGGEANIKKNLEKFQRRYTEDFFIHKDLKGFLEWQLKFYINQEILDVDSLLTDKASINEDSQVIAKVFKELSKNIIHKLHLLEDFKKKVWEKKKFILESNYVITLDKIAEYCGEEFLEGLVDEILSNEDQLKEWKDLFGFEIKEKKDLLANGSQQKLNDNSKEWLKLPIDTKHFSNEFKWNLLSKIENLDEKLNGTLIHSENWQALNLLQEKYKERIKCCYIDPPYNSESNEIIYKNNYKHSTWLSLIENRIFLSKQYMNNEGVFITAIDENEQERLGLLLNKIYPENSKTCITIIHNPRGVQGNNFSYSHEYAYFVYPNNKKEYIKNIKRDIYLTEELRDHGGESKRTDAKNCFYPIRVKNKKIVEIGEIPKDNYNPEKRNLKKKDGSVEIWPIDAKGYERKWTYANNNINSISDKLLVKEKADGTLDIYRKKTDKKPRTVWSGEKYDASSNGSKILTMMGLPEKFTFPKSIYNVKDCLYITTVKNQQSIVLDYFAGSGTTGHAVVSLNKDDDGNRKFLLVEMGEYFHSILNPRMKKVLYSLNWKEGKPQDMDSIGGLFKYHEVEQYEDALENIQFKQAKLDIEALQYKDQLLQYYLEDGIDKNKSKNFLGVDTENEFLDLKIKVLDNKKKDGTTKLQNVDLIETFNYLIGLEIEQMQKTVNDGKGYYIITGKYNDNKTIVIWREPCKDEKEKEKDRDFINSFLQKENFKEVFVNSDCLVNHKNIYDEMRKRLW